MTAIERPRVLFIYGAGHCGSTLLGMLLNGHPACLAVSEISNLASAIAEHDPVLDTPGWRAAATTYEQRTGARFADLQLLHPGWRTIAKMSPADIAGWARPRAELLACLAEATGRPWIVDGSKGWQQLYLLDRSGLFDLRVIHLVRDARGVVHSYKKKYGTVRHGLSKWMRISMAAVPLARRFPGRWLRVRYEDLVGDPSRTLDGICNFLEVDYTPAMLKYREPVWHGIGGNRMAKRADDTIRLDEKWRREMSRRDRLVVDLVGGAINRYHGY